jgi:predicted nucleic acid-binding protein
MRRIFIDTQGWVALKYRSDAHFQQASQVFNEALLERALFVTTNFVLDEVYTLLRRTAGHRAAVDFGGEVRAMPPLRIVHIGKKLEEAAWKLFTARDGALFWSFTDCTSFVVMEQLNIYEALTNDHEFEQAGFVKLLHS